MTNINDFFLLESPSRRWNNNYNGEKSAFSQLTDFAHNFPKARTANILHSIRFFQCLKVYHSEKMQMETEKLLQWVEWKYSRPIAR